MKSNPLHSDVSEEKRRKGRLPQESLRCSIGMVIDLSASGMRISTRKVSGGELSIVIGPQNSDAESNESVTVDARMVWSKRKGIGNFEAGYEFLNLDDATARKLAQIAFTHRVDHAFERNDINI